MLQHTSKPFCVVTFSLRFSTKLFPFPDKTDWGLFFHKYKTTKVIHSDTEGVVEFPLDVDETTGDSTSRVGLFIPQSPLSLPERKSMDCPLS